MRDRYPTRFNIPKHSRHRIEPTLFRADAPHFVAHRGHDSVLADAQRPDPFRQSHSGVGQSATSSSLSSRTCRDIMAASGSRFFAYMRRRLAAPECRRIVAMSQFARRTFEATHADADEAAALSAKLEVVYPNVVLPDPLAGASPRRSARTRLRRRAFRSQRRRSGGARRRDRPPPRPAAALPYHFKPDRRRRRMERSARQRVLCPLSSPARWRQCRLSPVGAQRRGGRNVARRRLLDPHDA